MDGKETLEKICALHSVQPSKKSSRWLGDIPYVIVGPLLAILVAACTGLLPDSKSSRDEVSSNSSSLRETLSHSYSTDEIVDAKVDALRIDPIEELPIELQIEREYGMILKLHEGYSQKKLEAFERRLAAIQSVNPWLIDIMSGKTVYILPGNLEKSYDGLNSSKFTEFFDEPDIVMMVHEFNHEFVRQLDDSFLKRWKETVEKYGFEYEKDLAPPSRSPDKSTEWSDGSSLPRDVFLRPYASNLSDGYPKEHIADMHQNIYRGRPIFVDTDEVDQCYRELFGLALEYGVFSAREYGHACNLLKRTTVENKFTTHEVLEEETLYGIGRNYGVSVGTIILDNEERYPEQMADPKTLQVGTELLIRDFIHSTIIVYPLYPIVELPIVDLPVVESNDLLLGLKSQVSN